MASIGRLIATLGVDTTGLRRAEVDLYRFNQRASASFAKLNRDLRTSGAAMRSFGTAWSMYVTAPLLLTGAASVKAYSDFEFSMTKIIGLVGVARERVEDWMQDVINLAPVVGKSTKELADGLFFITSAGQRGANAIKILEVTAKAAASGLGETKDVARLVVSAMNAWGSTGMDASEATDILTATVREANVQTEELAHTMGMVFPIASYMGVSFNEVGAAIAGMTRTGTSAQTSVIQLRQMLNAIIEPSEKTAKALRSVGMSAEELQEVIRVSKDTREEFKKLGVSTDELRKTLSEQGLFGMIARIKEATEKYGKAIAGDVFPNIRAFTGLVDLMGDNYEQNKEILNKLIDVTGMADEVWKEAAKTVQIRLAQAFKSVNKAATKFGKSLAEQIIPIIRAVAVRIQALSNWFGDLDETSQKLIIRIGLLVAAIGPLTIILGFLIGQVLPGLITMIGAVRNAFVFLTAAIIANPIGALITAITTLISILFIAHNRTRRLAEAQRQLNEEFEETEDISNRGKIMQFLRDLGVLKKELLEGGPGQFLEFERIDFSQFNKITDQLTKLPVRYLQTIKGVIEEEIVEVQRQLEGFISTGNDLIDQVAVIDLKEQYNAMAEALKLVNEELERAKKIVETKPPGPIIDPAITEVLTRVAAEEKALAKAAVIVGEEFELTEKLTNLYNQALMELAAVGSAHAIREMIILEGKLSDLPPVLNEIEDILEDFNKDWNALAKLEKYVGDEAISLGDKLQLLERVFKDLATAEGDALLQMEIIGAYIEDYNRKLGELQFEDQLKWIQEQADYMGGMFDEAAARAQVLEGRLWELFKAGKAGTAEYEKIKEELTAYYDKLADTTAWDDWMQKARTAIGVVTNLFSSLSSHYSTLMQNEIEMMEKSVRARGKSEKWLAREREKIQDKYGKKIQAFAIAEAVMNQALAIASVWKQWSAFPVIAGILSGIAAAAVGVQIATIKAQKFQEGGVVPAGYPNDTFPALLTSGETVLPAGSRLSAADKFEEVVFRIDGYELVGILKKQMSLEQNY